MSKFMGALLGTTALFALLACSEGTTTAQNSAPVTEATSPDGRDTEQGDEEPVTEATPPDGRDTEQGNGESVTEVTSPDGRTVVKLMAGEGQTTYSVTRDGEEIVAPSPLGFAFKNMAPLGSNMEVVEADVSASDSTWEQPWGERRFVRDNHKELFVKLKETGGNYRALNIRFRVFDDGVGFRYEFPKQQGIDSAIITDEITGFQFNRSKAWWIPGRKQKRYEYLYNATPLEDVREAHTPITLKTSGGKYVSLHEAALVDYSGMTMLQSEGGKFEANLAPWPNGDKVRTEGEFTTPWRTIQISDTAYGLMDSDLILNLNEPNKLGDVSWVEPSKYVGIWWEMHLRISTWHSGNKHGATTENTKRYIDFASENGFKGVLVEGWNIGWETRDAFSFTQPYPDYNLPELADYAKERGVQIVGHHETSGNISNYGAQMDDGFDLFEEMNISQVKTGYVAGAGKVHHTEADGIKHYEYHDGQYVIDHYVRVLESAAKREISINTHEPVKDTGLRRTYPNWISREGARGQEYNAWGSPGNPPSHTAILPYTRMLSGPMDFTPGIFDLLFEEARPNNRVETTLAKQLSLYVVIYSPIQMAADLPQNYQEHADAFQFIKDVPTDWAESIPLAGEIGDFVVIARKERDGEDWYLGGLTGDNPRDYEQELSFLEDGVEYEAQVYRDGDGADWETNPYAMAIYKQTVEKGDTLKLPMAAGGGFAVRFKVLN